MIFANWHLSCDELTGVLLRRQYVEYPNLPMDSQQNPAICGALLVGAVTEAGSGC